MIGWQRQVERRQGKKRERICGWCGVTYSRTGRRTSSATRNRFGNLFDKASRAPSEGWHGSSCVDLRTSTSVTVIHHC